MEIKPTEFDIEFIERTQKLIKNYRGDTEFTLLINCLLGLIIIPSEFNKSLDLNYLKTHLENIPTVNDCINNTIEFIFNPTHFDRTERKFVNSPKTLGCFLKKVRNGFSHLSGSEPINENGKWIGIKINDINTRNNNNIELSLTLKYNEIKIISEYISTEYQKEILNL